MEGRVLIGLDSDGEDGSDESTGLKLNFFNHLP